MLLIDGSYGEGGGQILRTSVALSSLYKIPIRVINIRKNRTPSGLKAQHLHAIKLLSKITNAKTRGLYVKSTEIEFVPERIKGGKYFENIGTAGSITLLLQAVILPILFADDKVSIKITGGTDVRFSPSLDYFRYVILPYLEKFANIDLKLRRRGFYPKGGGEIIIKISPRYSVDNYESMDKFVETIRNDVEPYDLLDNNINEIYVYSVASTSIKVREVAERMLESAINNLEDLDVKIYKNIEYVDTLSPGAVITIVAKSDNRIFGADAVGEKGKPAELVGMKAAMKLRQVIESKVSIDEHLADNLVPYLGLVGGRYTTYALTGHLETNIWVCEKFFGKIYKVKKNTNIFISTII
ncbi:MAG TPA: RNA 3'-terminal phosphate cyclase [Candidatus Nanopusillus sp.]|nr:RNA 3'-terminal phosphate cyclase [Candidatus Nanopusillus sp.]